MKQSELSKILDQRWEELWKFSEERERILQKNHSKIVKLLASTPLPTEYGDFTYMVFGDYATGEFHNAVIYGNAKKSIKKNGMLVRVHSSCGTSELFHAMNCECREELDEAMKRIRKNKSGMIIYLNQEGAGNGIAPKIKAYSKSLVWKGNKVVEAKDKNGKPITAYEAYKMLGYKQENRSLLAAAEIIKFLGIKSVRLMTNNPKKIDELRKYGIKVEPEGIHIKPNGDIVKNSLKAKAKILGHNITSKDLK